MTSSDSTGNSRTEPRLAGFFVGYARVSLQRFATWQFEHGVERSEQTHFLIVLGTKLEQLQAMLDESIDSYGYELIHFEMGGREKSKILRLYIDAPGGVTLDDCTFVSQQVSRLLDVEDPIAGQYTLEVSSPGIDRPLAKPEHFRQAVGERIEVVTHRKCVDRRNFLGDLLSAGESQIELTVDGSVYVIDYSNVRKANLKPKPERWN